MNNFTKDFILTQRILLSDSTTKFNQLAGTDNQYVIASYGYDEETGSHDYGAFAQCGNEEDAVFVYNSCLNYPGALKVIDKQNEFIQAVIDLDIKGIPDNLTAKILSNLQRVAGELMENLDE